MNNNIKMSNTETEFIGGQNRKWMGRTKNKQHFFRSKPTHNVGELKGEQRCV